MDTIVRGGTIVTASDEYVADIGIEDGMIVAIGRDLASAESRTSPGGAGRVAPGTAGQPTIVDATGTYVMPGAIDAHVHLDMPFGGTTTSDDYATGTIAAACGGVTTVVDYCLQSVGGTLGDALRTWHGKAEGKAAIDYGFHIAVTDLTDAVLAELPAVVEAGVSSIKCFMAYKGVFQIDDATMFRLLEQARELGALVNVHAENGDVIDLLIRRYVEAGMVAPRYHAASRPAGVEGEATARAIALAELARAPLNIVHMTCAESLRPLQEARDRGLAIYGETCPQYLLLDEDCYDEDDFDGFGGAKYVMSPPLRHRDNNALLWKALGQGAVQTLMTDHCSFRMADQKVLGRDNFSKIPNGSPGIETRVAIAYSEGVRRGHISRRQMVALLSTNAARMYGLYPRKGTIAVGGDADLLLLDPQRRVTLSAQTLHQATDYCPFEGLECTGYPVLTMARGEMIAADGTFTGTLGRGRFLRRGPHMSV